MIIQKGQPWGESGALPEHGVVVESDAAARAVVEEARRQGRPFPPLGLIGGDLCRTLGGPGDEARLRTTRAVTFPIDLGEVLVDGHFHLFVAHLVARNLSWRRVFVAMNAQWHGRWNMGPRAHPNDGLLDTYDARLGLVDVARVRARLHHGGHLPHPGIRERRAPAVQVDLGRPVPVRLDGMVVRRGRLLSVRVEPDALTVVV